MANGHVINPSYSLNSFLFWHPLRPKNWTILCQFYQLCSLPNTSFWNEDMYSMSLYCPIVNNKLSGGICHVPITVPPLGDGANYRVHLWILSPRTVKDLHARKPSYFTGLLILRSLVSSYLDIQMTALRAVHIIRPRLNDELMAVMSVNCHIPTRRKTALS